MRALSPTLLVCLALGACAGEPPRTSTSAPVQASEPAPKASDRAPATGSFTPPDASGFGRAGELDYLEEVVGDAAPTDTLPMLVLIHGRGDKPEAGWLPVALDKPVRVIMPRAPLPFGTGFSWFPNRALTATGPGGAELARALGERADQIHAAIEILKRERPTRGLPVAGGFSQGGMLSFTLAARHPHAFRAVLPIAGLLPETLFSSTAGAPPLPPVLALHGTADSLVPIEGARNAVRHLARIGYSAELREYDGVGHTITPPMLEAIRGWLDAQLAE